MPKIHIGVTLSDRQQIDLPNGLQVPETLDLYAERFEQLIDSNELVLELQPSDNFVQPARYPDQFRINRENRWLNAVEFIEPVRDLVDEGRIRFGVHQPPNGDLLSSNFYGKYRTLEEARRAMDFAAGIGADYFVINLAQQDKWEWARTDQHQKGLKAFKELATYYRSMGHSYVPLIETLPFPRFPATGGELTQLIYECQNLLPETRIALNISTLWRSILRMRATDNWSDQFVSFIDHIEYTLAQTWQHIHIFHLGGCWESEAYAVPGLHPQQNPFQHRMKLRESAGVYQESGEINLNRMLELLLEYTIGRDRDLTLVLEIHDRDIGQVTEAARQIYDDLRERTGESR